MAVNGISGIDPTSPFLTKVKSNNDSKENDIISTFSEYLNSEINKTSKLEMESKRITEDFAAGKTDNIHQVMIAGQKAEVALQFTMQIRNKILDAYNEIMRIQI